jgi:hypothetical protein
MGKVVYTLIHVPQHKNNIKRYFHDTHRAKRVAIINYYYFLFKIYLIKEVGGVTSLTICGSDKRGRTNQRARINSRDANASLTPFLFFSLIFFFFFFLFCLFVIIINVEYGTSRVGGKNLEGPKVWSNALAIIWKVRRRVFGFYGCRVAAISWKCPEMVIN